MSLMSTWVAKICKTDEHLKESPNVSCYQHVLFASVCCMCFSNSLFQGGKPRPNSLMAQKYYESGKPVIFRTLVARPVLLSQAMGAETGLNIGDEVEALKPGRFFKETWIPSMWKKAKAGGRSTSKNQDFIQIQTNSNKTLINWLIELIVYDVPLRS